MFPNTDDGDNFRTGTDNTMVLQRNPKILMKSCILNCAKFVLPAIITHELSGSILNFCSVLYQINSGHEHRSDFNILNPSIGSSSQLNLISVVSVHFFLMGLLFDFALFNCRPNLFKSASNLAKLRFFVIADNSLLIFCTIYKISTKLRCL